jgi:hypothetical protein
MNKEEEEAPLEDPRVHLNRLARHFTYLPPFKRTTLIKPMNKEEEEAPLEDPRVHLNRLARERHAPGLKKINMV